jgi:hypothetical protein
LELWIIQLEVEMTFPIELKETSLSSIWFCLKVSKVFTCLSSSSSLSLKTILMNSTLSSTFYLTLLLLFGIKLKATCCLLHPSSTMFSTWESCQEFSKDSYKLGGMLLLHLINLMEWNKMFLPSLYGDMNVKEYFVTN